MKNRALFACPFLMVLLAADAPPPSNAQPTAPTPLLPSSLVSPVFVTEVLPPNLPQYGLVPRILPAHRLALKEAGQPIAESDPLVGAAADRLEGLTARFVEDAPQIAELTIQVCDAIRASGQPAAPFAMLDEALKSQRTDRAAGNIPRRYLRFAMAYRKDHFKAQGAENPPPPPSPQPPPAPAPAER